MKLIKPYYKIKSNLSIERCLEMLQSIEEAGRTCYKSEEKITEMSYYAFIEMLIKKGHESVLEHEKLTIKFVCDRGVSHELVRHRLASFSQESTRYCDYSKYKFDNNVTFIIPCWLEYIKEGIYKSYDLPPIHNDDARSWANAVKLCEDIYLKLINEYKWTPQQARSVLPNSLKTEIDITANLREWRLIFKQRTSKAAHPQMRELMIPLLNELKPLLAPIFNDIKEDI